MKLVKLWWCVLLTLASACFEPNRSPKPEESSPPRLSGKIGNYSFERSADGTTTRFKFKDEVFNRRDFVEELASLEKQGEQFRELFNQSIATVDLKGANGIALKTPIYSESTADMPFYYVALPENFSSAIEDNFKDYFYHCKPRLAGGSDKTEDYKKKYWQTFGFVDGKFITHKNGDADMSIANGAVYFGSLTFNPLISPCPFSPDGQDNNALAHLYLYAKTLDDDKSPEAKARIQSLWYAAGLAINANLKNNKPTYFSTEGKGVKYLHLRAQTNTSFYDKTVKELLVGDKSLEFYRKKFPQ